MLFSFQNILLFYQNASYPSFSLDAYKNRGPLGASACCLPSISWFSSPAPQVLCHWARCLPFICDFYHHRTHTQALFLAHAGLPIPATLTFPSSRQTLVLQITSELHLHVCELKNWLLGHSFPPSYLPVCQLGFQRLAEHSPSTRCKVREIDPTGDLPTCLSSS